MAKYPNFYEFLPEANKRIKGTVIIYDGHPYHVLAIANHTGDNIFRVYMEPLCDGKESEQRFYPFDGISKNSGDNPSVGPLCDEYLGMNPHSKVIRKQMNSPHFNKFRPFPLGFVNIDSRCVYVERAPTRRTEQGLNSQSLSQIPVCLGGNSYRDRQVGLLTNELADTILGNYPTIDETFEALNNPEISNRGVAFDRKLALVRGPIGMLFLAYKGDIVGVFPQCDKTLLKLGDDFKYLTEVIAATEYFGRII